MDLYNTLDEAKGASSTYADYIQYKTHYNVLDSWEDITRVICNTYTVPEQTAIDTSKYMDPHYKFKSSLIYCQTKTAVHNSLYYIFNKYGSGAYYARIRNGQLVLFCYLWNNNWQNEYKNYMHIDPKYAYKYKHSNKAQWRILGGVVRVFEKKYEGYEIDFYYSETKYLILELCKQYSMPDCDFIVAIKDNLVLKCDLTDPNEEIVGSISYPIEARYKAPVYCPIFSYCENTRYADIPLPTPDDIIRIFSLYRANEGNPYINLMPIEWTIRKPTAVFRGSYTGASANIERNPRLAVCMMSYKWQSDPLYNGNNPIDQIPYLDAGITSKKGNSRGRKEINDKYIRFLDNKYWKYIMANRLSHAEQMHYKYILYIEGNVSAYRGAFLFSMGAVILWVKSKKYHLWFESYLEDKVNCIFIESDLSNLTDSITWLKQNDAAAYQIAKIGRQLYDTILSKKAILAYSYQAICNSLNYL